MILLLVRGWLLLLVRGWSEVVQGWCGSPDACATHAFCCCRIAACFDPLHSKITAPLLVQNSGVRRAAAALQQLGEFYMRRGQRARLPRADGDQLLRRLGAAELALPPRPGAA
jgi:hypothetical protein